MSPCRQAFEKWQQENSSWASEKDYNVFASGWLAKQDSLVKDYPMYKHTGNSYHDWPVT